ncbi:hypothetical protein CesoFtcFv8_025654 [Champsocephalus esox]|uniref:Uncharacterized protein n=1 Tax=Champsocephalus esox TaxID=159716 RepID=A0AAN8B0S3_9TELE|nr:hypothetical protein CesoFtcFv8_025654 [Champsocephalus esox]
MCFMFNWTHPFEGSHWLKPPAVLPVRSAVLPVRSAVLPVRSAVLPVRSAVLPVPCHRAQTACHGDGVHSGAGGAGNGQDDSTLKVSCALTAGRLRGPVSIRMKCFLRVGSL